MRKSCASAAMISTKRRFKPYLALDNVIAAAFDTANKLFGLTFTERRDIPVYHPDVRVWEVTRGARTIGLFYGDYFARTGKQGGAWMSSLRDQHRLDGEVLPLIINNCNFVKGDPALLSFDDARTVFHEFGHALHGLLSNVRFPRLSGTNVARDFVELPSQLYEHWLEEPQVLSRFARHHQTGEPMPAALMEKLIAARNFNQGFQTVEFLASAFLDMDFHSKGLENTDPAAAEAATLGRASACRKRSCRAMPPRISGISSPARAIAPAITLIYGRKCWMRMASAPSRRRTIPSRLQLQRALHDTYLFQRRDAGFHRGLSWFSWPRSRNRGPARRPGTGDGLMRKRATMLFAAAALVGLAATASAAPAPKLPYH